MNCFNLAGKKPVDFLWNLVFPKFSLPGKRFFSITAVLRNADLKNTWFQTVVVFEYQGLSEFVHSSVDSSILKGEEGASLFWLEILTP